MNRVINRAKPAFVALGVVLIMVLAIAPKTFAANWQNLPPGTEVLGWTANSTGITAEYSGNTIGSFPVTLPDSSYAIDPIQPLLTYYQENPGDASGIFPSGIGLTVSSNSEAVMTIFNFNPDQIGGQDIPPLTSLTASQESFLESAGYGTQLQTWEAEHTTTSSSSSAPPSSSSTTSTSTSSPPPSSSTPPSTSPPTSTTTAPKTTSPSSANPPTPVLPPVKPTLQKHPVKRAHPGSMPKNQRPMDLPHRAPKDPPTGPSGWVWAGAVTVVLLSGAGAILKLRRII